MRTAFALLLTAMMFASPAFAQTKKSATVKSATFPCTDPLQKLPIGCTPNSSAGIGGIGENNNLDQLWTKIQQVSIADLQYAKSLADATNTAGGKMRSACWAAWIALVQAQQGVNAVGPDGKTPVGAKPDPALFTTFEQLAEVVDSLQPTSPFMVACQPVANTIKQSVLNLVTMVVSGSVSLGALGVAIP